MNAIKLTTLSSVFFALGFAFPQIELPSGGDQPSDDPIEPREVELRQASTCANLPSFMLNADRIVGGQDATSEIPWQVSVRAGMNTNLQGGHWCGGTILDAKTILSAAHCFFAGPTLGNSGKEFVNVLNPFIKAGITDVDASNAQVGEIEKFVWNMENEYDDQTKQNDIIILKLKSPLSLNSKVQSACLPSANWAPENDINNKCFVSGWGALKHAGNSPKTLQWVKVPAISNEKCSQSGYGQSPYAPGTITNDMMCAGFDQGGKDACQGDSGGPLVCQNGNSAVISGVVSWGHGCAFANYAGIYSKVTVFLDWIKANMESDSCKFPNWKGDNFCDDENNNAGCEWDGGDCCGDDVKENYCTACECLDPAKQCTGTCGSPHWKGDNWCDDENNNCGCEWDGGDCCGNDVKTTYCKECECLDPSHVAGR